MNQNEQKKLVAERAIDTLIERKLIFSGMKIGLGTGSTAIPAVKRLAEKIRSGIIKDIKAVATSFQTSILCEELGIPVYSMNGNKIQGELDLAIDGADEIDPAGNLIKGGGAALLLEKIVAYNARKYIIVADETKVVPHLGTKFPLPVEIIPEARISIIREIEKLGGKAVLREGVKKCGPVITDNGNQILDCLWEPEKDGTSPVNPPEIEDRINSITGVVETGFFTKNKPSIFIARSDGTVEEH